MPCARSSSLSLLIAFFLTLFVACSASGEDGSMQLWRHVPLGEWEGGFVLPADLTGDGQVELLLSFAHVDSAHLRLVVLDLEGNLLWSVGDPTVTTQDFSGREPPCRPAITAFDFTGDGRTEVLVELWNKGAPELVLLAGETGCELRAVRSPFDRSVRHPEGYRPSRPAPQALVAHFAGCDQPPWVVLKYEASGRIPSRAVAYDHRLNPRWGVHGRPDDMGHHAVVADLTGDGRDEVIFGQLAVDGQGQTVFRRDFPHHADGVAVFTIQGETRVLLTICNTGPAYCLSASGETVWEKSPEEVSHGQAGWVGNFLPDRPGLEAVVLVSGHYGIFETFAAEDGRRLAAFQHHAGIRHPDGSRKYPDMPVQVRWRAAEDSLWVPVDRMVLDGRGDVVAHLGDWDERVVQELRPGATKNRLAVQAVPVDLCGDMREELILYQPYQGRAVMIFTQADSDGAAKRYVPQKNAYNRPAYF